MKLIINADDYGKDLRTTRAIVQAFSEGLCSSTTIIANGDAFEEAVELARESHILDKLGIHLNLTEGKPISEPIRRLNSFCDKEGFFNGYFYHNYSVKLEGLSRREKDAVSLEVRAQLERCLRSGLSLSHVDSHHHVHIRWEIWQAVEPVLRDYCLSNVRISRNCGESISFLKLAYKFFFNKRLRVVGFKTANYFGSAKDVLYLLTKRPQLTGRVVVIEVMVHPKYLDIVELYDLNGKKLADAIKAIPGWEYAVSF